MKTPPILRSLARCLPLAAALMLPGTPGPAQDLKLPGSLVPILPDHPGLCFPFQTPSLAVQKHEYAIPDWDGIGISHCEMDVVAGRGLLWGRTPMVSVVAAESGTISAVLSRTLSDGTCAWSVVLDLNDRWSVIYTFEPQSTSPTIPARQTAQLPGGTAAGMPAMGATVARGQLIGRLINAPEGSARASIGFALLYRTPGVSLDYVAQNFSTLRRVPARGWPAFDAPGCPWKPTDLGLTAAFFSPYAYCSPRAQQLFDALPTQAP